MFITTFTWKLHLAAWGLYYIMSQMKPIHAPYHIYLRPTSVLSSHQHPCLTKPSFLITFSKQKFAHDYLLSSCRLISLTFHITKGQYTINSILMEHGLSFWRNVGYKCLKTQFIGKYWELSRTQYWYIYHLRHSITKTCLIILHVIRSNILVSITRAETSQGIYMQFAGFWVVMNLAELSGRPTLYARSQGDGICFALSANPLSLILYKWLAPSLQLSNSSVLN
jgi:hypothetical protein